MTPPPPENGSRRAIDGILLNRLDRFEQKLDAYIKETEHRMTKLETKTSLTAKVHGAIAGAISALLTATAGALMWLWKGG